MTTRLLEIRDRGTTIPALAIQVSGADGWIMRRAGFETPMVYLIMLATQRCQYDPFQWAGGTRTMSVAHQYIEREWATLKDEDVIDVEFILGETKAAKQSDRHYDPSTR